MQDLLADGAAWLSRQRRHHCAQAVTYSRPSTGALLREVPATIGRTNFEQVQNDGGIIRAESRDFIIAPQDMKLDGLITEPAVSDRITDAAGIVFEVMSIAGEPHWRWADEHRCDYRIHTKQIATT